MQPVVKWSGSKRSQAAAIAALAPKSFGTYYEPFVGGGSVLYAMGPRRAVCGDVCAPLVALWEAVRDDPAGLSAGYREDWGRLQEEGAPAYYAVRERFNAKRDARSLLFLSRTCVNGLIRFNARGDFNNSLHHTRPGISPDRLDRVLRDWSARIAHVRFLAADYRETAACAGPGDFAYLDPPYFNTKGRYYGGIDFDGFLAFLEDLNARGVRFALSYDGSRGGEDFTAPVPEGLYKRKMTLPSGNSPFKKVQGRKLEPVLESLYLNY